MVQKSILSEHPPSLLTETEINQTILLCEWYLYTKKEEAIPAHFRSIVNQLLSSMDMYGYYHITMLQLANEVGCSTAALRNTLNLLERNDLIIRKSGMVFLNIGALRQF